MLCDTLTDSVLVVIVCGRNEDGRPVCELPQPLDHSASGHRDHANEMMASVSRPKQEAFTGSLHKPFPVLLPSGNCDALFACEP
jgi:hypothetical protein